MGDSNIVQVKGVVSDIQHDVDTTILNVITHKKEEGKIIIGEVRCLMRGHLSKFAKSQIENGLFVEINGSVIGDCVSVQRIALLSAPTSLWEEPEPEDETWEYKMAQTVRWKTEDAINDVVFFVKENLKTIIKEEL